MRKIRMVEEFSQDLRYALRILRRTPGVTAAVIVSLALGIGANTAVFSVIDALLIRTLPVERPQELFTLKFILPRARGSSDQYSYQAFTDFREATHGAARMLAASWLEKAQIILDGQPVMVYQKAVSGSYFSVLGVGASLGRVFTSDEDRLPPPQPVAVISYGFWQRRFGRDPAVLGRTFRYKGDLFTIVGVAPPEFFGETVGEKPDVWTPITAAPRAPAYLWKGDSVTWLQIIGRPEPGVTRSEIRARLEPVFQHMQRQGWLGRPLDMEVASRGLSELRERFSEPLWIIMMVVGLVLAITCANVANLLLERGATRRREIALRVAIGASRIRLVRQLLTESLLLALLGGGLGFLIAQWGAGLLVALASRSEVPIPLEVGANPKILFFTAIVSILTGLLFGLGPALRSTRLDLAPSLKETVGSTGGGARSRLGKTLVVAQLAISLVLIVAASLLLATLVKLRSIETGFNPEQVLVFQIDSGATGYKRPEIVPVYRRLLERAESVAGVRAASLSFLGLFTGELWGNKITVEGYAPRPDETVMTFANAVSARYFEVMGIPLIRGRSFRDGDDKGAAPVAIVNQSFARQFLGNIEPIGRRVGLGTAPKEMMEIVGVVRDAKYRDLKEENRPILYVPYLQHSHQLNEIEVRTSAGTSAVAATLRRELTSVDPNLPILEVTTLRAQVDASIAGERLVTKVSTVFGLLALSLAAVGLYGVLSYSVTRRTHEIGIRMALGASPSEILRLVLSETLVLVTIGIAIGVPAALAGKRLLESQLYGVDPGDPLALAGAALVLLVVALAAAYFPARRASRVDPMVALHYE